jgi:hypothetical protein
MLEAGNTLEDGAGDVEVVGRSRCFGVADGVRCSELELP